MRVIIHNAAGKILREVQCAPAFVNEQVKKDEEVMTAPSFPINIDLQKIIGSGDLRRVVNKTRQEIEEEFSSLLTIPAEQRLANITNKQWQEVLEKLSELEKK